MYLIFDLDLIQIPMELESCFTSRNMTCNQVINFGSNWPKSDSPRINATAVKLYAHSSSSLDRILLRSTTLELCPSSSSSLDRIRRLIQNNCKLSSLNIAQFENQKLVIFIGKLRIPNHLKKQ